MAQWLKKKKKNPPAMEETQIQSLGQEEPLEKGRTSHSSILAWKIPWTEDPGRLYSLWVAKSDITEQLTLSFFIKFKSSQQ